MHGLWFSGTWCGPAWALPGCRRPALCGRGDQGGAEDRLLRVLTASLWQELRSREEELSRAALQQKSQEELLKRREQQLAEREIDVLERELNILIFQLNQKPNVKKRKGKFRRSRLKLKDGHRISLPSGTRRPRRPRLLCVGRPQLLRVLGPGREGDETTKHGCLRLHVGPRTVE